MGPCGVLLGLGGVFKPFVMLSAAMSVGCGAVRLGGVLVMFGCSGMFFLWHRLTPYGIYPVFKSDEPRMRAAVLCMNQKFMPPTSKIEEISDSIE
jgi:hypothetical protein